MPKAKYKIQYHSCYERYVVYKRGLLFSWYPLSLVADTQTDAFDIIHKDIEKSKKENHPALLVDKNGNLLNKGNPK